MTGPTARPEDTPASEPAAGDRTEADRVEAGPPAPTEAARAALDRLAAAADAPLAEQAGLLDEVHRELRRALEAPETE